MVESIARMTVYSEHISLTNSRIRIALKKRDSKSIYIEALQLCKNDNVKAEKLSSWFSKVAISCKEKAKMNMDIARMRMWQLGNMDIEDISAEGNPSFVLTKIGSEKIQETKRDKWFEVLLWESKKQLV